MTHEENCKLQEIDGTIIALDESPTESPDEDAEDVETTDVDPSPDPIQTNGPATATDGGAQPPPEPDYVPADPSDDEPELEDDQNDETLPEHMVPVEDYLSTARREGLSEDRAAVLEDMLAPYDVVDVASTTADRIVAKQENEL